MRIGFDSKRAFYNTRGLGNYSRSLIQGLHRYYPEHEYILFSPNKKRSSDLLWNVNNPQSNFQIVAPNYKYFSGIAGTLWRSFLDTKPYKLDIYHGLSHEIPFSSRLKETRYITTIHDLIFLKYPNNFSKIDRNLYLRKIKYSCKNSDKIVAVSHQTKSDLINTLHIREEKIEVIHQTCNPVYYETVSESKNQAVRLDYDLPQEYILYVGAIEKHKNLKCLIDAIHILPSEKQLPLVIVGAGGSYLKEVITHIYLHKLEKRIKFVNYALAADLPAIYQMAKMLVFPSLHEGFGLPIIEALFSKIPVITSTGGCFLEAGGEGALYVNPDSADEIAHAIRTLIESEQLVEQIITNGYSHAQQFHQQKTSESIMKLYTSVL